MTTSIADIKRVFIDTSYVDACSLALVQSHPDIDVIFAFDHHLTLAGIPVLPGLLDRSGR